MASRTAAPGVSSRSQAKLVFFFLFFAITIFATLESCLSLWLSLARSP
jgi:hypothetical protein